MGCGASVGTPPGAESPSPSRQQQQPQPQQPQQDPAAAALPIASAAASVAAAVPARAAVPAAAAAAAADPAAAGPSPPPALSPALPRSVATPLPPFNIREKKFAVLLSYPSGAAQSGAGDSLVHYLKTQLNSRGFKTFVRDDEVKHLQSWGRHVAEVVAAVPVFVCVCSPRYGRTGCDNRELQSADRLGKPIFAVLADGCWPPSRLALQLSNYVPFDFRVRDRWAAAVSQLADAILAVHPPTLPALAPLPALPPLSTRNDRDAAHRSLESGGATVSLSDVDVSYSPAAPAPTAVAPANESTSTSHSSPLPVQTNEPTAGGRASLGSAGLDGSTSTSGGGGRSPPPAPAAAAPAAAPEAAAAAPVAAAAVSAAAAVPSPQPQQQAAPRLTVSSSLSDELTELIDLVEHGPRRLLLHHQPHAHHQQHQQQPPSSATAAAAAAGSPASAAHAALSSPLAQQLEPLSRPNAAQAHARLTNRFEAQAHGIELRRRSCTSEQLDNYDLYLDKCISRVEDQIARATSATFCFDEKYRTDFKAIFKHFDTNLSATIPSDQIPWFAKAFIDKSRLADWGWQDTFAKVGWKEGDEDDFPDGFIAFQDLCQKLLPLGCSEISPIDRAKLAKSFNALIARESFAACDKDASGEVSKAQLRGLLVSFLDPHIDEELAASAIDRQLKIFGRDSFVEADFATIFDKLYSLTRFASTGGRKMDDPAPVLRSDTQELLLFLTSDHGL